MTAAEHADIEELEGGVAGSRLDVRALRIASALGGREKTIVSGIDLSVAPGEAIGIVGESGSGKSMTARSIVQLLPEGVEAQGEILWNGRNLLTASERAMTRVRGGEIGLVFQDPYTMLNPLLRCGRHIEESLRQGDGRHLSRARDLRPEVLRRLAEVGIDDPAVADRYPFELSGGMRQRVGIAASLARNPRLLIADEPATALDVTTQREVLVLLKSLQQSRGMGLILITHDLRVAFAMCDRIYVLYAGSVVEIGLAAAVEQEPLHPYTLGLFLSEPPLDRKVDEFAAIEGSVADPDDVATCCTFAPRCAWANDRCHATKPPLALVGPRHESACVRLSEIRSEMSTMRARVEQPASDVSGSAGAPLVSATAVRKVFKAGSVGVGHKHEVIALDGVSIEVGAHESVGLVGESGSGKTTLGRCIVGLETPTGGEILIDGIDVSNYRQLSGRDRRRVRQTVQIIFQDPYSTLNPARTIGATLSEALAIGFPEAKKADKLLEGILDRVGLPAGYALRKPAALSGGERQRIAIARALAANPRMIVCDEPVSALDVSVQAQILNLFKAIRADLGVGYLFITHDLAVVRQIVDRVYVLCKGEVVEEGPVPTTLDHPRHPYTVRLMNSIPRSEADWLTAEAG
jgi:oligopeptide/dipeptide ABC transporter ATP-binding protein